ncbi:MAG TPA: TetR/AcrR family transcriptional regulator [Caulobacterales bacterium]|nr:TetR/AcrR family transcriptional regulator [Caulobacterales bacterium]
MDDKISTRDRIFHAAAARIKHYGYGKTTMAEIAADTGMSPGNIYRFFEAKIDIAEAMARKHYADEHAVMSAIARRKDLSVDQKLREIFFTRMRDNYRLVEENAKILEVAEVLANERPLFFNECMAQDRVTLGALLQEGIDQGLFAPCDTEFTAEMIQSATAKFGFPKLFSRLTLPKLERELDGVFNLIFRGLYSRAGAPAAIPAKSAVTA